MTGQATSASSRTPSDESSCNRAGQLRGRISRRRFSSPCEAWTASKTRFPAFEPERTRNILSVATELGRIVEILRVRPAIRIEKQPLVHRSAQVEPLNKALA